ncbi:unnamed protein product [Prorocentrum cordatum]|uniref:Subtilisin n=1 Tax=Prorocentrum cordatum TaxID=2364126 RepID=A0ABN9YEU1_9DINO|nr:unnamed protein product [Polarella glacialis]
MHLLSACRILLVLACRATCADLHFDGTSASQHAFSEESTFLIQIHGFSDSTLDLTNYSTAGNSTSATTKARTPTGGTTSPGVPIYTLPRGEGEDAKAVRQWSLVLANDATDGELASISREFADGQHTKPSSGQMPLVAGSLTEEALNAVLEKHLGRVRFVEEDQYQLKVKDSLANTGTSSAGPERWPTPSPTEQTKEPTPSPTADTGCEDACCTGVFPGDTECCDAWYNGLVPTAASCEAYHGGDLCVWTCPTEHPTPAPTQDGQDPTPAPTKQGHEPTPTPTRWPTPFPTPSCEDACCVGVDPTNPKCCNVWNAGVVSSPADCEAYNGGDFCVWTCPTEHPTPAPTQDGQDPTPAPTKQGHEPTPAPTRWPTPSPTHSCGDACCVGVDPNDPECCDVWHLGLVTNQADCEAYHGGDLCVWTCPTEHPTPAPTQDGQDPTPAPTKQGQDPTPAPTRWPTPSPTEQTKEPTPSPTPEGQDPTPAPTRWPTPSPTEQTKEPTPSPTSDTGCEDACCTVVFSRRHRSAAHAWYNGFGANCRKLRGVPRGGFVRLDLPHREHPTPLRRKTAVYPALLRRSSALEPNARPDKVAPATPPPSFPTPSCETPAAWASLHRPIAATSGTLAVVSSPQIASVTRRFPSDLPLRASDRIRADGQTRLRLPTKQGHEPTPAPTRWPTPSPTHSCGDACCVGIDPNDPECCDVWHLGLVTNPADCEAYHGGDMCVWTCPTEHPTPAPTQDGQDPTPAPTKQGQDPTPAPTRWPTPSPTEQTKEPTPSPHAFGRTRRLSDKHPTPAPTQDGQDPTPAPTKQGHEPTPAPTRWPTPFPTPSCEDACCVGVDPTDPKCCNVWNAGVVSSPADCEAYNGGDFCVWTCPTEHPTPAPTQDGQDPTPAPTKQGHEPTPAPTRWPTPSPTHSCGDACCVGIDPNDPECCDVWHLGLVTNPADCEAYHGGDMCVAHAVPDEQTKEPTPSPTPEGQDPTPAPTRWPTPSPTEQTKEPTPSPTPEGQDPTPAPTRWPTPSPTEQTKEPTPSPTSDTGCEDACCTGVFPGDTECCDAWYNGLVPTAASCEAYHGGDLCVWTCPTEHPTPAPTQDGQDPTPAPTKQGHEPTPTPTRWPTPFPTPSCEDACCVGVDPTDPKCCNVWNAGVVSSPADCEAYNGGDFCVWTCPTEHPTPAPTQDGQDPTPAPTKQGHEPTPAPTRWPTPSPTHSCGDACCVGIDPNDPECCDVWHLGLVTNPADCEAYHGGDMCVWTCPTEHPTPAPTQDGQDPTPAPTKQGQDPTPAPTRWPTPSPTEQTKEPTPSPTPEGQDPTPAPTRWPTPSPTPSCEDSCCVGTIAAHDPECCNLWHLGLAATPADCEAYTNAVGESNCVWTCPTEHPTPAPTQDGQDPTPAPTKQGQDPTPAPTRWPTPSPTEQTKEPTPSPTPEGQDPTPAPTRWPTPSPTPSCEDACCVGVDPTDPKCCHLWNAGAVSSPADCEAYNGGDFCVWTCPTEHPTPAPTHQGFEPTPYPTPSPTIGVAPTPKFPWEPVATPNPTPISTPSPTFGSAPTPKVRQAKVEGSFQVKVPSADAEAFVSDSSVKAAFQRSIAEQAGVAEAEVVVTLSVVTGAGSSGRGRKVSLAQIRLGSADQAEIQVDYSITVEDETEGSSVQGALATVTAEQFTSSVAAELSGGNAGGTGGTSGFAVQAVAGSSTAPTVNVQVSATGDPHLVNVHGQSGSTSCSPATTRCSGSRGRGFSERDPARRGGPRRAHWQSLLGHVHRGPDHQGPVDRGRPWCAALGRRLGHAVLRQ